MGIAALSDWLKQVMPGTPHPAPIFQPQPQQHQQPTIQPGVPLPTFQTQPGGGYSVQGLPPGASAFAPYHGLGVLQHPTQGPVYFDPTGQANDAHPGYPGNYFAMPMAPAPFKELPHMQQIGGF